MKFDINNLIEEKKYSEDKAKYFSNFNIIDVIFSKNDDFSSIKAENDYVLPYNLYIDLNDYLKNLGLDRFKLFIKAKNQELPIMEINSYLDAYRKLNNTYKDCVPIISSDGFILSYTDINSYNNDLNDLDNLKLYFYDLGYRKNIIMKTKDVENIVEELEPLPQVTKQEYKPQNNDGEKHYYKQKKVYTELTIDDLVDNLFSVKFTGEIFKVDEKTTKTGILIQTIYVKDDNNATIVKVVEGRRFTKQIMAENKVGKTAIFYGNYRFDNYMNDYLFEPDQIEFIESIDKIIDDAENKRVELHAHTKLSEMDGVSFPKDVVKAAYKMGHKAVAITDHACVQAYHEAFMTYKDLKKANPDNFDFKVLYGCEINMVYPNLDIVYNSNDNLLSEQEYVVFDLETTGLSSRHDYIIEFGAVLMYRGMVKEVKDFFIKPPIALSSNIKQLTNISDEQVNSARTFKECKDEILDFVKGRVLVAHNASFDYGFLNEELQRIGLNKLDNPVIDTLALAKSMFNKRSYSLGSVCKQYGVNYDEEVAHRANYDAEVLAQSFNLMLKQLQKENVNTLNELASHQGEDAFSKNRAYHTTVLCKNKKGLKDLYKLISKSHTETISMKESGVGEPRVLKQDLEARRENLLIGSACMNGEVFELAHTRGKDELAKAISFYDYIELQPLGNYSFLVEDRESFTWDRLKQYQLDIIEEAKRQNKIIVATGDVHYVGKDEKILRDVYICAQGIGGVFHPLYIYDEKKRQKQVTPDQHFFNTKEMLEAFKWLNDDELVNDIVINNTNKIADMCEAIEPFDYVLHPPFLPDAIKIARRCNIYEEPFLDTDEVISADEYLTRLVWFTAHSRYGKDLDPIIEKRIQKELNAIISNGYGVIYYVCHLMVKRSNDDGYIVGSRGSVGSSIVATFSGITEVNPLPPHYICPNCHHLEWVSETVRSGYDLEDKVCPICGEKLTVDGQNIPFETFLGFNGDKIPDIDLNFSGEYQPKAHLFTREIFGADNVFRAGTILTVKDKTAYGYVSGYCEKKGIEKLSRAQKERLAIGCSEVKRTTGQHAGGIVVLPEGMEIEDVTPIQYPANDINAAWRSTHFEYHDYNDNLLKFDILGHVDPTVMKLLEEVSGIDVKTIPMNDSKVLSLFNSSKALNVINPKYNEETGACGLPEFGTRNSRRTLEETRPKVFSELVQLSGLSHGTDVWAGNAEELIKQGIALADVIGCRDDIMSRLMEYKLESKDAFSIMEHVRKGKGLTPEEEELMLSHDVPTWYIESCRKIKYMFPKAHAVAYVIMAVRVAWFKVYHPEYYYVSYFSKRCDAYELETMLKDADQIYARMDSLLSRMNSRDNPLSKKEKDIFDTLEVAYEMVSRGYKMTNIDLYKSEATQFRVNPDNNHEIIPPFIVLDGLGDNVGESIIKARNEGNFLSKEDLLDRTLLSQTLLKQLDKIGVLKDLDESNQISLF